MLNFRNPPAGAGAAARIRCFFESLKKLTRIEPSRIPTVCQSYTIVYESYTLVYEWHTMGIRLDSIRVRIVYVSYTIVYEWHTFGIRLVSIRASF